MTDKTIKAISLGWGVQSWTLCAMSALGELEPVDVALHSDTTWERQATYEFARQWTPWLEERGVRAVIVSDAAQARKVTSELDIPAFTKRGDVDHIPAHLSKSNPVVIPLRDDNFEVVIPAHHSYPGGQASGMLRRQCTHRWKIEPMRRWLRSELKRLDLKKSPGTVEQWLGITIDEVHRAKDSDVQWIAHRFPLLEKRMTRQDCIIWLEKHGLPIPPKSSCVFCPYHTRKAFAEMKQANGADWRTAVEVDEAIRNKRPGFVAYVHPDRIPLIELKTAEDFGAKQLSFVDTVNAECDSGYCFL